MPEVERPAPFVPVLLAWLLPGAGHLKIGKLWPGVFVAAAVVPLFVAGLAMTGFENVSWERHPFWFWGAHVWGGAVSGIAAFLTRHVVTPTSPMPDKGVGELFTGVACLLNLIALSDVWSRCGRGDPEDRAAARAAADAPLEPPAPASEAAGG